MTSLRERFADAEKQQSLPKKAYNQLHGLSGELAAFASGLPKAIEDLVIRAEAGQPTYTLTCSPSLRVVFKTGYYAPYLLDDNGRREFPGHDEMQDLQGFRKLLDTCANPAVDVCVRMAFSRPSIHRSELALTVDINLKEAFAASTFSTRGAGGQEERHAIGADYIAAQQKPFKAPAVLSLQNKT
ncbi:MAG: hypothetical protein ACAH80_01230 [Alphaproteobacteria bacterium]